MEATMTRSDEYGAIGFGGAFARQFRLLWDSRRPLLLAVALLAVLVLAGDPWTNDAKMRLLTVWPVWLVIVPIIWAFAIFHNEGPSSRHYFWSQPVGRSRHTLARVAAGLAWMWIVYAVLVLGGWIFGLVDGDAWQLAEIGLAGWVNVFTGTLITYLMVSILTIPSDYPIRWFFGIIFFFPLLISLFVEWLEMDDFVRTVLKPLADESWGLGVTLVGGMGREVAQLDHTLRSMADPTYSGSTNIDLGMWWTVTPVWTLLFVAVVVFIATRHPDRLPKLRGIRIRR